MFCAIFINRPLFADEVLTPELILSGIKNERIDNVRAYIDLSRYRCDEPDWRLGKIVEKAKQDAGEALKALGYYKPDIFAASTRSTDCWSLELTIQKGGQVIIESVSIKVAPQFSDLEPVKKLLSHFPLQKGRGLEHASYTKAKRSLMSLAHRFGYFEAVYSRSELRVDPSGNQARIILHMDAGPRYRVGAVSVHQQTDKDRFIDYFITLKEGDDYDSQQISSQAQVLNDSGYFSEVEITSERAINPDKVVPVDIHLTARKRYSYRVGVGVSTDVGIRGSLRFENRQVNRRGHTYIVDSSWSKVVAETDFNYAVPLGDSGQYRLDLGAGYRREDIDTSSSTLYKTGVKLTRLMSDGWQRTLSIDWTREDYRVLDRTDVSYLLMPGVSWSKTVRNHPLYPTHGWRLYVNARGTSEALFSDVSMLQLAASAKKVNPAGAFRMISRLGAGTTDVNNFDRLPSSLRFYAGGDNSVRGFEYKSLGPVNEDNDVTGGKHNLTASVELEYPFKKKWGVAVFTDMGNAFNDFNDYDLKAAVGVGFRYHSPIGPVRIDIASDVEGEDGIRLHISMGPDL
ncbi:MAG: autotransporter assembly complex family protein [Gammaproteobacteria bacterium]